MFCEKCGNTVRENEKFCSKCGAPVKAAANDAMKKEGFGDTNADKAASDSAKKAKDASGKTGGGGKKFLLPVIIGVVVLLAVGVLVANGASLNNFVHKTFSSPESYYQFVEKNALDDIYSLGGDVYGSILLDSLNFYDKSVSGEIAIELGKDGEDLLDMVGDMADVDLSWLTSVQLQGEMSIKDSLFQMGGGASLNKDSILSLSAVLDLENEEFYFQVPELTKTWMGMYMDDVMDSYDYRQFEEFQETQEMSREIINALPSESQMKKLLKKYGDIALKYVDDVSKGSKTLKVDGIQQKCTELKVTIDADTFFNIMEAVLEEMAEDRDIENLIINVAEAGGADGDEAYEYFLDGIDDLLDDLDYSSPGDGEIIMKVYVDGKGQIRGRIIEWEDSWGDEQSISLLTPKSGSKVGFEFSIDIDDETLELSGSGKQSGNKVTGEYELKYEGISLLDITTSKLNVEDLKKGRLNGEVGLKMSSTAAKLLGNSSYDYGYGYSSSAAYLTMLTDLELRITGDSSDNSSTCKVNILYDDQDIATVTVSAKTGSGSKASVPGSKDVIMVEDDDDALDWLEEIDWDKVISNLEKTDLPSEVIDMVEDIADAIEDEDYDALYYMFY